MIESLLVMCGLLVLFSPWAIRAAVRILATPQAAPLGPADAAKAVIAAPTYQDAMAALAMVRKRILGTNAEGVPKDAAAAIEVITHALVEGSDQ